MKKIVSLLIAMLIMVSSVVCALPVFAEDEPAFTCTCGDKCLKTVDCKCCIYCSYTQKRMNCVKLDAENNAEAVFCCGNCTGWLGCNCGEDPNLCNCSACKLANQDGADPYSSQIQIFDSDTQKTIIKVFRTVLEKMVELFNKFFDAIADFLRLYEFLGREG